MKSKNLLNFSIDASNCRIESSHAIKHPAVGVISHLGAHFLPFQNRLREQRLYLGLGSNIAWKNKTLPDATEFCHFSYRGGPMAAEFPHHTWRFFHLGLWLVQESDWPSPECSCLQFQENVGAPCQRKRASAAEAAGDPSLEFWRFQWRDLLAQRVRSRVVEMISQEWIPTRDRQIFQGLTLVRDGVLKLWRPRMLREVVWMFPILDMERLPEELKQKLPERRQKSSRFWQQLNINKC